jgi:hypothetical protein
MYFERVIFTLFVPTKSIRPLQHHSSEHPLIAFILCSRQTTMVTTPQAIAIFSVFFLVVMNIIVSVDMVRRIAFASDHHSQIPSQPPQSLITTLNDNITFDSLTISNVVVFYNVYLANTTDQRAARRALDVLREQITQIGNSPLVQAQNNRSNAIGNQLVNAKTSIFYTSIGFPINQTWMQTDLCDPFSLNCRQISHFDAGYEERTLEPLHQFCMQHPQKTVIYLHNKGSFHAASGQNAWRWIMTEAVVHEQCWNKTVGSDTQCDVCGLLFVPTPMLHYTGNMWMAKCSYVKKLHPMYKLVERRTVSIDKIWHMRPIVQPCFCPSAFWNTGNGRYLSEHWIPSHPQARLCDLSPTNNENYWKKDRQRRNPQTDFVFHVAPRFPERDSCHEFMCKSDQQTLPNATELTWRHESFVPDKLMRWCLENNAIPDYSSWTWTHFPEGGFYRQALLDNGFVLDGKEEKIMAEDGGVMNCTRIANAIQHVQDMKVVDANLSAPAA